jgi:hypothetical protein
MRKRAHLFIAAAVVVSGIALALGSCAAPGGGGASGGSGFLGTSFTLSGQISRLGKDGIEACLEDGDLLFGQGEDTLFAAPVSSGAFSVQVNSPAPSSLVEWADILPPVTPDPLTVSDGSARGYAVTNVALVVPDFAVGVSYSNLEGTNLGFFVYTDKDVHISGSGTYSGPNGTDSDNVNFDIALKEGWSRIILSRTGVGPYTDTWRLGDEPAGLYWLVPDESDNK